MPAWIQQRPEERLLDLVRGMAWWPPLPNERGATRWGFRLGIVILKLHLLCFSPFSFFYFYLKFSSICVDLYWWCFSFVFPNCFADRNAAIPNFSLVNQASLDKILKAEVFAHIDGQLKAAHLILDYILISNAFQAPMSCPKSQRVQSMRKTS